MSMSRMALLAAFLFLPLTTGCATIVSGGGPDQAVVFRSSPSGADVYVDGQRIGVTPVSHRVTRNDPHVVRFERDGVVAERTISPGVNPWTFGNVVFGGLIGAGTDLVSGASVALPGEVHASMASSKKTPREPPEAQAAYAQSGSLQRAADPPPHTVLPPGFDYRNDIIPPQR